MPVRTFLTAILIAGVLCASRAEANDPHTYVIHEGCTIPELGLFNLTGNQANKIFTAPNLLAADTSAATNDTAFLVWALVNGTSGGEYDHGVLCYWNLESLPADLDIRRAWFEFYSVVISGYYIVNGNEGVALRPLGDPENRGLWTQAWYDADSTSSMKWKGASWRFHDRVEDSVSVGTKWSNLPSTGLFGFNGDLSSVLDPITSDTVRISYPLTPGAYAISTDATDLVRSWVSRQRPNLGIYMDASVLLNRAYLAAKPNRLVQVGITTHSNTDVNKRPRLVVEAVPPRNSVRTHWTIYAE